MSEHKVDHEAATMAKKQHGWLVRDPKGEAVVTHAGMVNNSRDEIIYGAWVKINSCALSQTDWWRKARREGYTVERIEL